ncbi:MAG TPA: helix-hairpin-helix domain-containing protein [Phycisphaerae bacterium]|nr:helix-hairpin-helix domain-containing protein [Phycisphaerae bacterium]
MGPPEKFQQQSTKPDDWGWSRPQRTALAILLSLLLALLLIQYLRRPFRLDDPITLLHGQPLTLPSRIDPNTATLEELTRIPHIGEKVAAKLLAYRDARKPLTPDNIVFRSPEDLARIPGLGKKTATDLTPYFEFPPDPDTQPGP